MNTAGVFERITTALDKSGITYMLTGSFAASFYGAPRTTQDIDLVIEARPSQLQELIQLLPPSQYYVDLDAALEALHRQSLFNVVDMATGWKIDFIVRKSRPFSEEEFRRRKRVLLSGTSLFVCSPEDAVLSKLEWVKKASSSRQIEDVASILRVRGESLDADYLRRWVMELGIADEWEAARRASGIK